MISATRFNRFLELIHRSEIHTDLETLLRPAGEGGRPRGLRIDVFLAAIMATVEDRHTALLTQVHRTLTKELSRNLQVELGIRDTPAAAPVTLRQVRYLMSAIAKKYDTHAEGLGPEYQEARANALQDIVDRLLATTTQNLDSTHRYAIDATSVEAWAKGKSHTTKAEREQMTQEELDALAELASRSADSDASYGHRTKTYGDRRATFFGYHLTSFVRIADKAALPGSQPIVTERILLSAANQGGDVTPVIGMLDRITAADGAVEEVIADRAYSNASIENWARPLRERGITQVLDLRLQDHGATYDEKYGFVWIDGWPHDPSVPEHLRNIARPATFTLRRLREDATSDEVAEHKRRKNELERFNALIAERQTYAYVIHQVSANGAIRYKCPGAAGKLKTTGCEHSTYLPIGLPTSTHPEGIPTPKACVQSSVQVRATVREKHRQQLYWGCPEWQGSYGRRTAVEGKFGILKGTSTGFLRRGWTQQTGRVKSFLLLALSITVVNLKVLTAWARRTGDLAEPLAHVDLTDHGFLELNPDGNIAGGVSPPIAD